MSSKTLKLIEQYKQKLLREQGELPPADEFNTTDQGDVTDVNNDMGDENQDEVPMTSRGEDQYISDMVDAALFEPSSDDAAILSNLQSVMKMKKYNNAREEILPVLLNIIRPSTGASQLRGQLNDI